MRRVLVHCLAKHTFVTRVGSLSRAPPPPPPPRFKTRSGDTVRLVDLLDEAVSRMESSLRERASEGRANIFEDEVHETACAMGYGAVKYFDLPNDRDNCGVPGSSTYSPERARMGNDTVPVHPAIVPVEVGEVGYEFRKGLSLGWFVGKARDCVRDGVWRRQILRSAQR